MEKNEKRVKWQGLAIIILAILLTSITIFIINDEKEKISEQKPEKVYIGMDKGEPAENFSKAAAVSSLQSILSSVEADVDGKDRTIEERMKALDKEDTKLEDVINKKTIDGLYLSDDFKENNFNKRFAASALLTYHQVAITSNEKKSVEILANDEELENIVYMDSKLMLAQIPIDIFIGENRGISFEMQYINGEWKLSPYSAMMSLVMIVNYEKQMSAEKK